MQTGDRERKIRGQGEGGRNPSASQGFGEHKPEESNLL